MRRVGCHYLSKAPGDKSTRAMREIFKLGVVEGTYVVSEPMFPYEVNRFLCHLPDQIGIPAAPKTSRNI